MFKNNFMLNTFNNLDELYKFLNYQSSLKKKYVT